MTFVRSRCLTVLLAMAAAVAPAACKKEGIGDASDLPAELRWHPAQGDPSKLAVPALFASIPADTPYLLASLDAVPPALWARMAPALEGLQPMVRVLSARLQSGSDPVGAALLSEMEGKWNQAGIESLGFSAQPRFAIYGLGLQPVVARLVINDGKAVRATFERIAAKAGKPLPPAETRGGRTYWQHANADGTTLVVSIADHELVAAVGKADDVAAKLGLILGLDKPANSMADGALVKQLMARHGFGGQLIGFADTRQLAGKAIEAAGAAPSPACTAELDQLSAKLPRAVVGYSELSGSKAAGGLVIEMAPELVTQMRGLETEIPGLGAALAGRPMMAFAAGVDLARGQQLGIAAAGHLQQLATACGLGALGDNAARAARELAQPLPEPFGRISGAAVVIDELAFRAVGGQGPTAALPDKLEGIALIASPDARALFNRAGELTPQIKSLGLTADGKLHPLQIPIPLPAAPSAGVGDRLIVATAGDKRKAAGDGLLGMRSGNRAPLFVAAYDFGKLMDLTMRSNGVDPAAIPRFQAMMAIWQNLFGRVSGMLDVTDHGLAFWSTVEFK